MALTSVQSSEVALSSFVTPRLAVSTPKKASDLGKQVCATHFVEI